MNKKAYGFTIVELLIVVVVIAILAAITIVSYNGVSGRARASAVAASTETAAKKVLAYMVQNSDQAPADLATAGIADDTTITYQYSVVTSTTPQTFCITGTNQTVSYFVNNTNQTSPTQGACPGHGVNGVAPITNLAADPQATAFSVAGLGRWANDRYVSYSTYSLLTGIANGPAGLTTAVRLKANTTSAYSYELGFHVADNLQSASPIIAKQYSVTAGQVYTISAYVRWTGASGQAAWIRVRYANDSNAWASGASASSSVSAPSGQWVRLSYTVTVPVGATKLSVMVTRSTASTNDYAVNDTFDATGLMVTSGPTLYNYADGSSPNWVWNGTAGSATSTGPLL